MAHTHRPRRILHEIYGTPFHLAQCACGLVANLSNYKATIEEEAEYGKYTLEWDLTTPWRDATNEDQGALDEGNF